MLDPLTSEVGRARKAMTSRVRNPAGTSTPARFTSRLYRSQLFRVQALSLSFTVVLGPGFIVIFHGCFGSRLDRSQPRRRLHACAFRVQGLSFTVHDLWWITSLQGYLAHKKPPHPRTLQ